MFAKPKSFYGTAPTPQGAAQAAESVSQEPRMGSWADVWADRADTASEFLRLIERELLNREARVDEAENRARRAETRADWYLLGTIGAAVLLIVITLVAFRKS